MRQKKTDNFESNDPASSAEARGKRIKRLRNLANLSREQFCKESDINIHTLIGWENGRFGGLTRTGAMRIIKRLALEGVSCTLEWLLSEIGAGPQLISDFAKAKSDLTKENLSDIRLKKEDELIANELILFRQQNVNATDFIVQDDGMFPPYAIGDYVAGKKRFKQKIATIIGYDCIVQTEDGRILLRNVRKGPHEGVYNLVCSNPHTQIKDSVVYSVKLISAAPVIWHRKKDPK